jgi:hypothetical protein
MVFSKLFHVIHGLMICLERRCWESLLVKQGNDALLTQHELDDTLSLMLVELLFFFRTTLASTDRLPSRHMAHPDAKAGLRSVDLLLGLLLMLLSLALHFVDSLLEKFLKLCLTLHLFVVLQASHFEESSLILKHLAKLLNDSLVTLDLFFFRFDLSLGYED